MHPADWKKLRELRPVPKERPRPQLEVPRPMVKCPRDGTVVVVSEGVCPMCGDFV